MAKQLNVNLSFTADTAKARAQIQELSNALNQITKAPLDLGKSNMTKQLQEASVAAAQLKNHIENAVNVDTGTLDFSKLNASFKKSGTTMVDYAQKIAAIGPTGQQALAKLATAVNQAEIPIRRSNAALAEMVTTLKNTARWQLSSSMLHGFMGAMQSAYGYAQDLDKSLNNIRIVAEKNTEQMALFAEQANKAAKSLSTTTTKYTDASLIYYQQGLDDSEVAKRTEVTIKMANAAGQSAEIVSDQLTAIWNNFYDGSKSLEYYADVMTALGAATASSTDEIAGGLEKFAAIGETIGLSYEYAASALATITSNTRQSEEVVGTALKTIFARIQGLNLGETLDDGTSLNKYSEALDKVGISIFEQNGEIKKMDSILDEMAAKWGSLAKDQQIALAQTVAGVRQYTQLIALMDNWNAGDSDSMLANLNTAYSASGTLQEQADIYAESWDAAQKRVRAALEGIYTDLLDPDFFIGLLNGIEDIVSFVDRLIDSLGGLGGVLSTVSVLLMRTFSNEMAQKLRDMAYNLQMSTEAGRQKAAQEKNQQAAEIGHILSAGAGGEGSLVGGEIATQYEQQRQMQQQLAEIQSNMSEEEILAAKQILDIRRQIGEEIVKAREAQEQGREKAGQGYEGAMAQLGQNALDAGDFEIDDDILQEFTSYKNQVKNAEIALVNLKDATDRYQTAQKNLTRVMNDSSASESDRERAANEAAAAYTNLETAVNATVQGNDKVAITAQQANSTFEKLVQTLDGSDEKAEEASQALAGVVGTLRELSVTGQAGMTDGLSIDKEHVDNMVNGWRQGAQAANDAAAQTRNAEDAQRLYEERLKASKVTIQDWASKLVSLGQSMMSIVSIVNSAKGAIETLTNPDASGWEKFSAVLTSFASITMMTVSMVDALRKANFSLRKEHLKGIVTKGIDVAATGAQALATGLAAKAEQNKAKWTDKATKETKEETVANLENAASELADKAATEANSKSKGELGTSLDNLKTSFGNLKTSAGQWLSSIKGVAGGVGLVAAGVAVAVGAIAWAINQYQKYDKAAQEAAEQADKAAEAYQKVSEAYQSFTGKLSAYEDAQNGLEGMTKGTLEYREAVLQANEAAMELLNTYEGLTYSVGADGLITIDEQSLNDIKTKQMDSLENAQQSQMLARQNANDKQLQANSKKFQRDELKSSQGFWSNVGNIAAATGAGAGSGALIGAGLGAIGGPLAGITAGIGALAGAITGLVTGVSAAIASGSAASEEQQALENLSKIYTREGNAKFASDEAFEKMLREELKIDDDGLIKSLVENRESTLELVKEMAANTAQTKAMNEQAIRSEHGDAIDKAVASAGGDESLAKEVTEAMGAGLSKRTEELYNDKYKDKMFGMTDADIQKAYAEAMGWNVNKIDNHSGNKATYYDDKGNVVAAELDDEIARRFLAQQAALEEMGLNINEYVSTVQDLVTTGNKLGEGIGNAISTFAGGDGGNLSTLSASQFKNAGGALSSFNENSQSFTFNGMQIDDAYAKKLGYENAQEFYKAFTDEMERVQAAWDGIDLDVMKSFGLDPKVIGDMSLETATSIQNALEKIELGPLGEAGGQAYIEGLNKMISDLNPEDQQEALSQLSNIDWSDWDAMDQAKDIMKEFGVEIDVGSKEWQEFIDKMRTANLSMPDFSKLKEDLNEVYAILNDLDFGDAISEEDYERLVAYNDEWERFFMLQADGTRQFIGDSEDMKKETQKQIIEQKKHLEQRKQMREEMQSSNWNVNGEEIDWYKSGDQFDYASTAQNLINQTDNSGTGKVLAELGYTDDTIREMIQDYNDAVASGDEEALKTAKERFETMYNGIGDFMNEDFNLENNQLDEMLASSASTIAELNAMWNDHVITSEEAYNKGVEAISDKMIANATSLAELDAAIGEAEAMGAEVSPEERADALITLAESYETCTEEIEKYKQALSSGNEEEIANAEATLRSAVAIEDAAEKYDLNAKSLKAQAKEIMKAKNMTEDQAEAAALLAIQNQRLNKGLSSLVDNWKDWKKQLQSTDTTSQDYADTLVDLSAAVTDLVGWYEDLSLDSTFVKENMELIEEAATGDIDAIIRLSAEVANASVGMATLDETLANGMIVDEAGNKTINALQAYADKIGESTNLANAFANAQAGVQAGFDLIANNLDRLNSGESLESVLGGPEGLAAWVDQLNAYAAATGMTADEMQTMLSSVGVTANVQTDYQEQQVSVPTYLERSQVVGWDTYDMPRSDGNGYTQVKSPVIKRSSTPGPVETHTGYVGVASISMDGVGESPGVSAPTFTGRQTPSASSKTSSSSGSSSSGSSGSISKSNKSTERYKTINDKLDDSSRSSERLKNKISKTTGQEQKDLMDKLVEEEKHYKKLVEDKLQEARNYLEDDYADLNAAAAVVDVQFKFDAEGNIVNYEEEMSDLYERLDQAENDALADGEVTEAEQELIDTLQEQVETLEEAIATYDETRETAEDLEDELEDLAGMPPLPTATSDLVDIYKEVNDELDDIEDRLEKINDESDRLTGAAKIKKLREAADIEKEKLQTLKEQAKVINKDIAEKQENLDEVAARHGLSFNYDENGNISNYDEEMGRLTDEYQSMYEEYAADGEITEAEQANLDAKQATIDEITGYADAYSSAVEEGEENAKEQLASKYAIQDKNAEALTLTLEMNIEINERDLQRIEYYLGKMEDDFYSAAEAAALMVGNLNGEGSSFGEGGQLGVYLANLNAYQTSFTDLQAAYENGDISQADYVEGLKAASDGMYENLQNLQDLDDAMMNYYADTLAAAGEEIAKYTDQMEHQSSVLDHYKSIMEIMGKSNDYKKMGKILEGQASLAKDQAQVAKQTMEMYKDEADKKYALYQEALARGDSAAAELYKKEYEAALEASSEAEDQYLAKAEAYAESLKAILENKLADLGQDLENALTGGTSFDQLASGLSRAASIQEEYLTTTNQIYETNKLMRTAQQEIDKTSNSIAKNRLKQFINETDQLQNQNKLSKYELEIQQAKYNLLLAEIAAEEAQSAKSTVRLQRDSEGNFGYVYTADSSKMAEAEQKLQDAQNRLYNIGLDGANQYTEKYQQTLSEMYSTLTDLQSQYLSGAFESEEEYNNAVAAAKEYYYEKLEQYSSLHAVALTTDSRVIEDAWSTQFSTMVYSTESWKNSVDTYVDEAAQAFIDWKAEMTNIETELGLDDIETAVDDVKTASQELATELTKDGGVIDSLKDELTEVGKVTGAYANQRTTIQGLITDYEDLATSIDATIQKMLEIPEGGGLPTDTGDDDDDDDSDGGTGGNSQDDDDDSDGDTGGNSQDDDDSDGDTGGNNQDDDDDSDGDTGGGDPAPQTGTWERIMQAYEKICSGAWGNGLENRIAKGVAEGFTEDEIRKAQQYINYTFPPSQNGLGYSASKAKSLLGFDTGGYTGDWGGAYGKMALLHKKELVLNEGDTENFLQSMNLLDKIVAAIDLHSMNAQLGGMLSSPTIGGMREHEVLEQKVHIEASFPGVSDRNELEEAFNNLINQASQYANRF